jgi:hypothetical protein
LVDDGRGLRLDVAPLVQEIVAAGPATATLAVSATGEDRRQWVAILCLEQPDGALVNLAEGITTAMPGATEVTVELGDVCVQAARGARLVLLVAGGLAGRFPPPAGAAVQRVHGCALELTVAGGGVPDR